MDLDQAFIVINQQGVIQSLNFRAVSMFGYLSHSDLIGKRVEVLMPPPHRHQHHKYIRNYQQTNQAKVLSFPSPIFLLILIFRLSAAVALSKASVPMAASSPFD